MSKVFACERCGSKSFAHDDKACELGDLKSQFAIAQDHLQKLQITNGDLTDHIDKLKHQNQKLRKALTKIFNAEYTCSQSLLAYEMTQTAKLALDGGKE